MVCSSNSAVIGTCSVIVTSGLNAIFFLFRLSSTADSMWVYTVDVFFLGAGLCERGLIGQI